MRDAVSGFLAALRATVEPAYRAFRYGAMTDKAAAAIAPTVLVFCLFEMCILAGTMLSR